MKKGKSIIGIIVVTILLVAALLFISRQVSLRKANQRMASLIGDFAAKRCFETL